MMLPAEHRANVPPMPPLIGANTVQVSGYYQPQRGRFAGQLIDRCAHYQNTIGRLPS